MAKNLEIDSDHYSSNIRSDDFINIEEPPMAKDSPQITGFDSFPNDPDVRNAYRLHRRGSTNYWDDLNRRGRNTNHYDARAPPHPKRRSESYGMNAQDAKHDMLEFQNDRGDAYNTGHDCIPKGDYLYKDVSNDNRFYFKPSYTDPSFESLHHQQGGPFHVPNLERRRSSFEYEDFKKDIYDRLKLFETK